MKQRALILAAIAATCAMPSMASHPASTATAAQAAPSSAEQNNSKEAGETLPPYFTFLGYKLTETAINALLFGGVYYALSYTTPNSKAVAFEPTQSDVTLTALAGEKPKEINSLIEQIQHPEKYAKMNASIPTGVLLHGKPGTGKTKLAQAIAGELDVPFFEVCGAQLENMWIGEAEANIRKLFDAAKNVEKTSHHHSIQAVVFIDEIDSIAPGRNNIGSTHHTKQTVDQLLAVLNNAKKHNILVIGATNYLNSVDEAVRRPGRFDITVEMTLPSSADRLAILRHYTKNDSFKRLELDQKKFDEFITQQQGTQHLKKGYLKTMPELFKLSVNLDKVAQATDGMSGAELKELCNKARRACVEANPPRTHLEQQDFDQALGLMGKKPAAANDWNAWR